NPDRRPQPALAGGLRSDGGGFRDMDFTRHHRRAPGGSGASFHPVGRGAPLLLYLAAEPALCALGLHPGNSGDRAVLADPVRDGSDGTAIPALAFDGRADRAVDFDFTAF